MKKCKQHKKTQCRKKRHLLTQPRLPWAGWFPLVGRVAGFRVLWVYQHSWLLLSKKAAEYSPAVFLPTLPDSNQQELVRKQKSQLADYSNGLIITFKNLSLSKQFFFFSGMVQRCYIFWIIVCLRMSQFGQYKYLAQFLQDFVNIILMCSGTIIFSLHTVDTFKYVDLLGREGEEEQGTREWRAGGEMFSIHWFIDNSLELG